MQPAFKMLARVARIMEQLNSAWDVLRTMTPAEYTRFREALGQSSGFQSWQYRLIEFAAGNRNPAMLKPHEHRPDILALLQAELARPSLYDEALRALDRRRRGGARRGAGPRRVAALQASDARHRRLGAGLPRSGAHIGRSTNWPRSWWISRTTSAAGASTTSPRSNGSSGCKRGTGGTGGVSYLRRMLEVELFPELWQVRTEL